MNKRQRIVLMIVILSIIIVLGVVTFAYFTANITGNPDTDNVIVETGTLRIEYIEGQNIDAHRIRPGWNGTKRLSVKNTGTLPVTYDLIFGKLENTFINDELVYTIDCESDVEGNTCLGFLGNVVPEEKDAIIRNVTLTPGETHSYEVLFDFIEIHNPQDYNNKAVLNGRIEIVESNT